MKRQRGFTLVEVLVVVTVFLIIITAVSATYVKIFSLLTLNKIKVSALNVANEQIEIIHNLPYADVGEINGIPNGKIPSLKIVNRNNIDFNVLTTIRNIDDPFDGQIGSSTKNDTAPADYKLVQVDVSVPSNPSFKTISLVTNIAPKSLENSSSNGALFIKVFDSNGNPVSGAQVNVINASTTPTVSLSDVTDINGRLDLVDVPPSNNYQVNVTKNGYSSDRTYTIGGNTNPNPVKPDSTVVTGQLTQVSFAIDKVSSLQISTVDSMCVPVPSVALSINGSKIIGSNPNIYKFASTTYTTNSSGLYTLNNIEWDSYNISLIDPTRDLLGTNPLIPINLLPNSNQNIQIVVGPKSPRSLLFSVKDNSTLLPVTDAYITLTKGGSSFNGSTGRGFISETDWSGAGYSTDNNLDITSTPGNITLKKSFGVYASSGWLESGVLDLGGTTTLNQILWTPIDQPISSGSSSVRLQIALSDTNTATTTWNYVGPDGTNATYFTTSNQDISPAQNIAKFIKYKAYLSTNDTAVTPTISDIMFTYASECTPPGQVYFGGLTSGTYDVTIVKNGYQDYVGTIDSNSDFIQKDIILTP